MKKRLLSILVMTALLLAMITPVNAVTGSESDSIITLTKTATPTEKCREFEIELTVTGQPVQKPIDVILVIDRSGSMGFGNPTPLSYAKQAAIAFAETILANKNNRVGIVSYSDSASIRQSLTSNLSSVRSAINGLTANGGTNIKDAFDKAKAEMTANGRKGDNYSRAIILLSDGIANLGGSGPAGSNYPQSHNSHTRAAISAGKSAQSVATVFTVGLFAYISGDNQYNKAKPIAEDTLFQAQDGGFYQTNSAADLTSIYQVITNFINNAGTNSEVTDVIDEHFKLVAGSVQATNGTTVYDYDADSNTLTWRIGNIGSDTVTLKYKVKVLASISDAGTDVPTNKYARLDYTDINNVESTLLFPVPTVDYPAKLQADAGEDRTITAGESTTLGGNPTATGGYPGYTYLWSNGSTDPNPAVSPTETTTYTVTVTDSKGCKASDSVTVFVNQVPVKTGTVIVKYVDEDSNEIAATDTLTGNVGADYTTSPKTIEGYTLKTTPENASGKFIDGTITVVYVYAQNQQEVKTGTVIVKYVDEDGNEIAASDTLTGNVGEDYTTSPKTIEGYTLKTTPENASGKFIDGTITVIYGYETVPEEVLTGTVIVEYVDEEGNELAEPDTLTGNVGEPYTTTPKEIEGYTLKRIPENSTGVFVEGTMTVTYVYEETPQEVLTGTVIVEYVDEEGNELAEPDTLTGNVGEPYTTSPKEIEGYTLKSIPENSTGVFAEETITVTYVYEEVEDEEPEPTPTPTPTPTYEPDPTPTPTPEPTPTPSDTPDEEEIEDDEIPSGAVGGTDDEIILDEEVPAGSALPKTGGYPPVVYYGVGSVIALAGYMLRKKIKERY